MKESKYKIVRLMSDGTWKEFDRASTKEEMDRKMKEHQEKNKRICLASWVEIDSYELNG